MKKTTKLVVALALLLPLPGVTQEIGINQVKAMAARIAHLHAKGVADLQKFDVLDSRQLRACIEGHRHDVEEAKLLMERARDPNVPTQYRPELIRAADGAHWCLSCASHQRGCDQASHALATLQKLMAVPEEPPPG